MSTDQAPAKQLKCALAGYREGVEGWMQTLLVSTTSCHFAPYLQRLAPGRDEECEWVARIRRHGQFEEAQSTA